MKYMDIGCNAPDTSPEITREKIQTSEMTILIDCHPKNYRETKENYKNNKNVIVLDTKISPANVVEITKKYTDTIDILKIDIDGYDYFVLDEMLNQIRPHKIYAEINEKIPPPVKFTVLYDDEYSWDVSHFFGMSLSKAYDLCLKYDYALTGLDFNNIELIDKNKFDKEMMVSYTPEELYKKEYIDKNYHNTVNYNLNVKYWQDIFGQDLIESINNYFIKYNGKYVIE
jgi:hypothetical protein